MFLTAWRRRDVSVARVVVAPPRGLARRKVSRYLLVQTAFTSILLSKEAWSESTCLRGRPAAVKPLRRRIALAFLQSAWLCLLDIAFPLV